ncbi:MAG TPA: GNAT family N-acetyltransferase [Bryobacteraceae bacterium]|nr:GNAT family N-acetyltransferase [Bryobacteraceae bacterium]
MPASDGEQPIEYGIYTAQDADAMARLLGEVFSRRDPPAVAVGLTAPEFEAFVRLYCSKAAAEGLTILARHAGTLELAGALLAEDSALAPPGGMERLSPKFEPIFDILGQLDAEYRCGRPPHPGESLHLFLLGVAESAAGRGVAQHLVTTCLEYGARKGYQLSVTEATNTVSQHIFRKLGFVERVRRSYSSHRFAGRAMFASIAEQGGPILMDRSLAT